MGLIKEEDSARDNRTIVIRSVRCSWARPYGSNRGCLPREPICPRGRLRPT